MKQAQHHSIRKHKWCCLTEEWDKQIEVFKKQRIEIKINNGERQGEKKAPRGMNRVNILFKHYNTMNGVNVKVRKHQTEPAQPDSNRK